MRPSAWHRAAHAARKSTFSRQLRRAAGSAAAAVAAAVVDAPAALVAAERDEALRLSTSSARDAMRVMMLGWRAVVTGTGGGGHDDPSALRRTSRG
jgi:hypothetical protein